MTHKQRAMSQISSLVIYFIFILIPGSGIGVLGFKRAMFIIGSWLVVLFFLVQSRVITTPFGFLFFMSSFITLYLFAMGIGLIRQNKSTRPGYTLAISFITALIFTTSIATLFAFKESLLGINLFLVPSKSMEPILVPGDVVLVDSWKYHDTVPVVNDIVVFYTKRTKFTYIKRVKAVTMTYFDAEGDNPRHSVSSEKLRKQPLSNLRGKAIFVLLNIKDKNIALSRFPVKL